METGDIVLVALREFEEDKADIVHKYYTGEATHLIRVGEIPDSGSYMHYYNRSSLKLICNFNILPAKKDAGVH